MSAGSSQDDRRPPRGRDAYATFITLSTRWADNDAYGHVNNAIYYAWFDSAVNQWLVGQGLLDIMAGDPVALVVDTRCRYFAPLCFPGNVDVGLAIERVGTSSVTYRLGVFAAGSAIPAAEGHFVHVAVSRADHRPVPWPEAWRGAFGALTIAANPG